MDADLSTDAHPAPLELQPPELGSSGNAELRERRRRGGALVSQIDRALQLDSRVAEDWSAANRPAVADLEAEVWLHIDRRDLGSLRLEAAGEIVPPFHRQAVRHIDP